MYTHEHSLGTSPAELERQRRRHAAKEKVIVNDDGYGLIERTLKELEHAEITPVLSPEERKNKRRSLEGVPAFESKLDEPLMRKSTKIFQVNIGLYCNQACAHCHVESSPRKIKEQMDKKTVDRCLEIISHSPNITTVDITGGAPELNANFRYFVEKIRSLPKGNEFDIIDRCNLTVLMEPGQEDLGTFLKKNKVHVIASLPCYGPKNVNEQRGIGVFDKSIAALLKLNDLGYGMPNTGLEIDLVYNPIGAFLPPDQDELQTQYKKVLDTEFGIQFNKLYCITNMPIKVGLNFYLRSSKLTNLNEWKEVCRFPT